MTHPTTQYALDVAEGRIVTGELVRYACQRHLDDLEASRRDLAYPFYFDEDAVDNVLGFCPLCRHFEGEWAGRPFEPAPWQVFILGNLFGWLRRRDHSRRFRKAFVMVGRKNGKTLFAVVVGYYVLLLDGEPGAQESAPFPATSTWSGPRASGDPWRTTRASGTGSTLTWASPTRPTSTTGRPTA